MNEAGQPVLHARGLTKRFTEGGLDVEVLRGVDLEVHAGRDAGHRRRVGFGQEHAAAPAGRPRRAHARRRCSLPARCWPRSTRPQQGALRNQHLGFVYQFHHLLPEFSALDNVAMPLRIRREPHEVCAQRAQRGAGSPWAWATALAHRPAELSGGERQRVAIARALVTHPACVLADEPTGNLDRTTADAVFDLMLQLARDRGTAFVLVTHDEALAARCGRRLHLVSGKLA